MNKPLAVTQRQIRAICEGAKKAGYAPVLEIGNVVIRLIPEDRAIPPQVKEVDAGEEDFELLAEAKSGYRAVTASVAQLRIGSASLMRYGGTIWAVFNRKPECVP